MTLRDMVRNVYVYTHWQDHPGRSGWHSSRVFAGTWSWCGGARGALQPVALPRCFLKQFLVRTGILDLQGQGANPQPFTHPYLENSYWSRNKGTSGSLWTLRSLFYIRHLLQSFKPGRYYLHHWKTASTNCCHQIIFGRISFTKITSAMSGIRWKTCPPISESGLRCL